jgi:CHAT domain-containing protein
VLAFGDPVFPRDSGSVFGDTALPRLQGSGREARLVARYAGSAQVRLRARATAEYLRTAPLDSFDVIHLATHALVDERALGRTALVLAPSPGAGGFVTPGELAALRLDAALVVLSACRTAGGVVLEGEGVQGLTAPLLQAGARSVVATSWRVGDRSAARFVERLYDELATGKPVVEALQRAKLRSIADVVAPGVWASFSVVGDPMVRVPLRAPHATLAWWAAGAALVATVVAAAWTRRRAAAERD